MSKGSKVYDVINAWVEELSLAPMGQNGKKYLLVKAMKPKDLKALLSAEDEELTEILEKAGLGDEALEAGEVIGRLIKAYGDTLPEGFLSIMAKATGMEEPVLNEEVMKAKLEDEERRKAAAAAEAAAAGAAAGGLKDALAKADTALRDEFLRMQKSVKDQADRVEAMEKARTEEYFDKLMGDIQGIPGDQKVLRKALEGIRKSNPIDLAVLEKALRSASLAMQKGALGEAGVTGHQTRDTGSPEAKIMTMAKAKARKDGTSIEEAMVAVIEADESLYEAFDAERRKH